MTIGHDTSLAASALTLTLSQGERGPNTCTRAFTPIRPHPNPLPKGEGTETLLLHLKLRVDRVVVAA